jgi:hypothetical protein
MIATALGPMHVKSSELRLIEGKFSAVARDRHGERVEQWQKQNASDC